MLVKSALVSFLCLYNCQTLGIAVIGASCCDRPASCLVFLLMLCYCECDCVLVLCVVMFKSGKVNKLN